MSDTTTTDASALTIRVVPHESGYRASFSSERYGHRLVRINVDAKTAVDAAAKCLDIIRRLGDRPAGTRGRYPRSYRVARWLV